MRKKVLVILGAAVATPSALLVAFYFWASSGALPARDFNEGALLVADEFEIKKPNESLTIVTYNVGYASGLTNNTANNASESEYDENLESIIKAMAEVEPDLVAFQEIDYGSKRSYGRDQLDLIADGLGLRFRAQAFNWDDRYVPFPYTPPSAHFGRVLSGQALASGLPVLDHSKVTLVKPSERPFYYKAFYLDRVVQISTVDVGDVSLTILNVHLEAYMNATRQLQALEVIEVVKRYNDGPLLLVGDFNAQPPWVGGGVDEEGRADHTLLTIVEETGLKKAIPESAYTETEGGRHLTFPSGDPVFSLDHIFYNDHIERLSARVVADAGTGSDHLPVVMTFRINEDSAGE